MDILYPQDYVAPVAEAKPAKDAKKIKDFIKSLVAEKPMNISKIVDACDQKYVETNSEDYHYLVQDIRAICEEIEAEWRPVAEEVIEP